MNLSCENLEDLHRVLISAVKEVEEACHSQNLIDAASSSQQPISQTEVFSADFILSICIQAKLSGFQYEAKRAATIKVSHIFPRYKKDSVTQTM